MILNDNNIHRYTILLLNMIQIEEYYLYEFEQQ